MQPEVMSICVDNQKMWASVCLNIPVAKDSFFTADYVETKLYQMGIIAGLNRQAIFDFVDNPVVGREVVVAEAVNPIHGQSGYYDYKVEIRDEKTRPTIREDGSVDYYNCLSIAMVNVGDFFAEYFPATEGTPGYNIYNEPIAARKGKELPALKGTGFSVSEDGREYRATSYGRIYLQNEKIIVNPIYTVEGDLGIEQGNLFFNGDVEIKGDVRSGIEVVADGSIFIHGHVGGCIIKSGKSITIRRGVQGREKCIIAAEGDIACSFIERCSIKAGGSVYADSIMTSDVDARNQVIVKSKKGLILGGNVLGSRGVLCKTVGNDVGITTNIRTGYSEKIIKRASELVDEHCKIAEDLELLERNLKFYTALDKEKRTKETEATRKKILQAKIIVSVEKKKVEEELAQINEEMKQIHEECKVLIHDIAYAGTKINIGKKWFEVKEDYREVVFVQKADKVVVMPLEDYKPNEAAAT